LESREVATPPHSLKVITRPQSERLPHIDAIAIRIRAQKCPQTMPMPRGQAGPPSRSCADLEVLRSPSALPEHRQTRGRRV